MKLSSYEKDLLRISLDKSLEMMDKSLRANSPMHKETAKGLRKDLTDLRKKLEDELIE